MSMAFESNDSQGSNSGSETRMGQSTKDALAMNSKRPDRTSKKPKFATASFADPIEWVYFDVGPTPHTQRRQIHKEAIYVTCDTFRAAFESGFTEGQTKVYSLPETNLNTFVFFQQWVYSQTLNIVQLADDYKQDDASEMDRKNENQSLVELWVFADKYNLPILQNTTIDKIYELHSNGSDVITAESLEYVYNNTSDESVLRRYVVEICVIFGGPELYDTVGEFPAQMWTDLCKRYATNHSTDLPFDGIDIDDFHVET